MLTSVSLQIDKYTASANLFLLRRNWLARVGTMSTVRAGSCTGWWSFSIVDLGVRWLSATVKTLVNGWPVWMKVSPIMPVLEVHMVSYAAEEMGPL